MAPSLLIAYLQGGDRMSIYVVLPETDKKSASLIFGRELNAGESYFFNGQPQQGWRPLTLEWNLERSAPSEELQKSDFSLIIGAGVNIVLNDKAKVALDPVLGDDVEYLSVNIKGEKGNYYLLNVLHVVDNALALDKSEFRLRPNGEIGVIRKAVFDSRYIPDNRMFIYPQMASYAMFKGERFKDICIEHGLTGLEFEEALIASS